MFSKTAYDILYIQETGDIDICSLKVPLPHWIENKHTPKLTKLNYGGIGNEDGLRNCLRQSEKKERNGEGERNTKSKKERKEERKKEIVKSKNK